MARPYTPPDKLLTGCIRHLMETLFLLKPQMFEPFSGPESFGFLFMGDLVYKSLQDYLAEIIISIRREIRTISTDTCAAVVRNFRRRLYVLVDQGGTNLEHIL